jgi:prepilin-type N-terminal cleavage/methylation domain-containing protein
VNLRNGFTLVEVIVGMLVGTVAITLGFAALAQTVDSGERVRETEQVLAAAAARRTLIAWLEGAHLNPSEEISAFRGLDRKNGHEPDDEITFYTTSAQPFSAGGTYVRLWIDRSEAGGLKAELRSAHDTVSRLVPFASAATGLDAQYLFGRPPDQRWLEGWVSSVELPRAVRLTISGPDSMPPLLRLPVLVPLGGVR